MSLFLPVAHAQTGSVGAAFGLAVNPLITHIIYPIVELMFGVAVLVFTYGVLRLVFRGDDEEARTQAKSSILYGVLGMFIMVSAWGIIYLVSNTVKGFQNPQQEVQTIGVTVGNTQ